MTRIMALAVTAIEHGEGLVFAHSAARRIWSGEQWSDDSALGEICAEAGLDLKTLEVWARENEEKISETIAANEAAQLEHHWGVPLMVLEGEPFFGQDRIESLRWRLDKLGLKRPVTVMDGSQ